MTADRVIEALDHWLVARSNLQQAEAEYRGENKYYALRPLFDARDMAAYELATELNHFVKGKP